MIILATTKCYRTVISELLCVLAGCLSLDLVLDKELDIYYEKLEKYSRDRKINFEGRHRFYNIDDVNLEFGIVKDNGMNNKLSIITDGSKISNFVGCAPVEFGIEFVIEK